MIRGEPRCRRLAPRRLRVSGGRGGIDLVDLPKFTCDLYMADRIEEVAKKSYLRLHARWRPRHDFGDI